MSVLSSLVKDTAIYGLSSMVGRFLNWLLTFVYVRILLPEEYGVMTNLYSLIAILLIVMTYGMETAFFRFASKHERPRLVFGTALTALGVSSMLFVLGVWSFDGELASLLDARGQESLILMLAGIIALDAFCSIPLAYLRYAQRPWYFLGVRLGFVAFNIVLTLGVFYGLPWLEDRGLLSELYQEEYKLQYIFGINLLGNVVQLLLLLPVMAKAERRCSLSLLGQMLAYALPILLLGLAGNFSSQADKLLMPYLYSDAGEGMAQLGIYSACYKLAVIMVLFTQAFRYAYDPFVFSKSKEGEDVAKRAYSEAMLYYTLFTLLIFVAVISALDVLKLLILPTYYEGLVVVPLVMLGQLMFGIYFNLSLWYKLTDRTYWGTILSVVSCALMVGGIIWTVPRYGFIGVAWSSVVANAVIMCLSYILGQRYYPIRYPLGKMAFYTLVAGSLVAVEYLLTSLIDALWLRLTINALLLLGFALLMLIREVPRSTLISLGKRLRITRH